MTGKLSFTLAASVLLAFLCGCGGSKDTSTPVAVSDVPVLSSVSPTSVTVGSASAYLTLSGSGFLLNSTVEWNGAAVATTYANSGQLTAQLPAPGLAVAGQYQLTVFNTGAGGGSSAPLSFSVVNPPPILGSISATSAPVGASTLTIVATGTNFVAGSLVQWNGSALTTTYVSSTQLSAQIPASALAAIGYARLTVFTAAPGGGQSNAISFAVTGGDTRVSAIPLNANDIVWDAAHSKIYASLPGANGTSGNSVVAIDPVTSNVGTPQAAGSEPNLMAISSDAAYLWVGLDGSSAIQRFNLPGLSPDITIHLPAQQTVLSIEAAPASPHTVAALEGIVGYSPQAFGGAIYDDATPRQGTIPPDSALDSIQWGSDDTQLYGEGFLIPSFARYAVDSSGITTHQNNSGVSQQFVGSGHFDRQTGDIYADDGQVINPVTADLAGSFNLSSLIIYNGPFIQPGYHGPFPVAPKGVFPRCIPDASRPVLFCVGMSEYGYAIQSFDKNTLRPLNMILLPQVSGKVLKIIRWGRAGLAFNTVPSTLTTNNPGSIYVVDGAFVDGSAQPDTPIGTAIEPLPILTSISPQTATAGSSNLVLSIYGSNFLPGALAYWDTSNLTQAAVLQTTYVNPGELQVTLSSAQLANAGYNSITVANGPQSNITLDDVGAFTVLPPNTGIIAQSLASYDVAWSKATGLLYAAVWDLDTQYPNSIVAIDPSSGKVVQSQTVGSNPYIVRPTSDGAYLYTAYLTSNSATRLQLTSLANPLTWSLRDNSSEYPWIALDLQPAPGASQTCAVSLGSPEASPVGEGGVTIFDNNVPRPVRANGVGGSFGRDYISLQWGKDTSTLFSGDITDFYTLSVNSSGVSPLSDSTIGSYQITSDLHIRYDAGTGKIYDDDGKVIDPVSGSILTNLGSSGLVAPDSSLNRIFILGQTASQIGTANFTIQSFNQKSYAPVSTLVLPGIQGDPQSFIRWGTSGFALVTYIRNTASYPSGMLYIVNDPGFSTQDRTGDQSKLQPVSRTWNLRH